MKSFFNIFSIICLTVFISCSSTEQTGGSAAESLYNDIKSNYKGKRYMLALEKISTFRSKYPYSFYVTEVELLRANIFYEQENYLEAVDAYLSFRDFHPNYEGLDEIEWRIAESFYKQLPDTVDRDITPSLSAINSFQDLIRKFPKSAHVSKAKDRIEKLEKMLEDKELYIADFYFRTEDFQSASYRYAKILKATRSEDTLKNSAFRLIYSFYQLGKKQKCLDYIKTYQQYLEKNDLRSLESKCTNLTEV